MTASWNRLNNPGYTLDDPRSSPYPNPNSDLNPSFLIGQVTIKDNESKIDALSSLKKRRSSPDCQVEPQAAYKNKFCAIKCLNTKTYLKNHLVDLLVHLTQLGQVYLNPEQLLCSVPL